MKHFRRHVGVIRGQVGSYRSGASVRLLSVRNDELWFNYRGSQRTELFVRSGAKDRLPRCAHVLYIESGSGIGLMDPLLYYLLARTTRFKGLRIFQFLTFYHIFPNYKTLCQFSLTAIEQVWFKQKGFHNDPVHIHFSNFFVKWSDFKKWDLSTIDDNEHDIYKIPYEEDCSWTFAVKERSFYEVFENWNWSKTSIPKEQTTNC